MDADSVQATRDDEADMRLVQTVDDHQAFGRIVERWRGRVLGVCIKMTGDVHLGEDLAQETFARLYACRHDYKNTGKFPGFIHRVAGNLCHDELRRRRRETKVIASDRSQQETALKVHGVDETPLRLAVQKEECEIVRRAILALPDIYRAVIMLRHYENLRLWQIAKTLSVPQGTVNSRMAQALVLLACWLNAHA